MTHGQYLTFMLGGEQLALGILAIKEIIEYGPITEVPMTPRSIRGVINLRGSVVPVVDLAARFRGQKSPVTKKTCIVIVETEIEGERQVIGAVVDTVNAVIEIAPEDIEAPPAFGASIRTDFIEGMGRVDGNFIVILNAARVLSIDEATCIEKLNGEAARSDAELIA
jgi:purine-binding chemotaxis protein CheW